VENVSAIEFHVSEMTEWILMKSSSVLIGNSAGRQQHLRSSQTQFSSIRYVTAFRERVAQSISRHSKYEKYISNHDQRDRPVGSSDRAIQRAGQPQSARWDDRIELS